VRAVDGVDFEVLKGETLGVVGESGCGKSTTARLLMQLMAPTAGEVIFDGRVVGTRDLPLKDFRRQVQMVFQDSYASLNPRLTIEDSVAFGPQVHGVSRREAVARARDLLARGPGAERFAERYPHELSGGQRQRVNIARALALQPRLVILDEAVSALDKSVEAQVLNLLQDLKREFGLTYVFISHDLNVVHYISDRVMVMYLGQVAEIGPSDTLFRQPGHPYTGPCCRPCRRWTRTTAPRRPRWPATRPTRSTRPRAAASTPLPAGRGRLQPARPGAHRTGRPPCARPDARGRQRPPRRPGHPAPGRLRRSR
jgi:peptide/nickel transport system ATP-binding protein